MNKCVGCGALIQSEFPDREGYIRPDKSSEKKECERCFRMKHYGDYQTLSKEQSEFSDMLTAIDETGDLVLLVVDLWNIPHQLEQIKKYLHQPILLVLNKRDLLPYSITDEKLFAHLEQYHISICDQIVISSTKNHHLDQLLEKIHTWKRSNRVYIVGFTNSGKSTLLNKMIYHYSDIEREITTSMLPNTTLGEIEIPLADDLILVDTPGLLDPQSLFEFVTPKELKKIIPTKEIRPVTYQIRERQGIFIDTFAILELEHTNITCYVSNRLTLTRKHRVEMSPNFIRREIHVPAHSDLVISGLGFFKVTKECQIVVYTVEGVDVFTRKALV